ncbi:MAG: hypothetical protein ACO3JL_14445 [Myxococcota bacterium]
MHSKPTAWLVAGLAASSCALAAGCAPELHIEMGTLSAALSDGGSQASALTQGLGAAPGASYLLPQVDGMRLVLQGSIPLCKGRHAGDSDCSNSVLRFDEPVEVELDRDGGALLNLAESGTPNRVAAGEFDFAQVRLAQRYALKARFQSDEGTVYTTAEGLRLAPRDASVGDDYDYWKQDALYPQFADEPEVSETTFFPTPLAHDGTSPLALRLLVDLQRAGRFSAPDVTARFEPAYLNLYVSAAADSVDDVQTYLIANDQDGLAEPATAAMTVVFSDAQTLLGGRVRFASDLSLEGEEGIEQFLARWSCDDELCTFVVGDYGTGEFEQSATGFRLLQVGEAASTFTLETSTGRRELHYERVAE